MLSNLVFLGPPGAGKGTQATALARRQGLAHVSTGEMFRSAIRAGSALGLEARGYLDRGSLVPDQVTCKMVREILGSPEAARGFILDGFPRTCGQARTLNQDLQALGRVLDTVVRFILSDEAILERLGGRETCSACGTMFHGTHNRPERAGICDQCQGTLVIRDDDQPETILKRLEEYREKTEPVVSYYRDQGLLREVTASGSIETVEAALEGVLAVG